MIPDLNIGPVSLVEGIAPYRAVLLFVASAGLGALGAWGITAIPFRERLLDLPNERSSHTDPTPRGGGVGILAAFMLAGLTLRIPTIFLFSGLLISSVSLYGDFFRISVRSRLFFQVVASLMILFPLLPRLGSHYLPQAGSLPLPLALILLVLLLFIVGTANFFNFMDGINGIAGLTGAVGFGLLGLHALNRGPQDALQAPFAFLAFCIALACLGYLPFNLPRAKVFMGDVGSILLGFVFAGLAVTLARDFLETICLAAFLFPFYADELTTMAIRLRDRENLLKPHRRHLYQLLVNQLGIAHWKITVLYGVVQLLVGTAMLIAYPYGFKPVLIILAFGFGGFTLLGGWVRRLLPPVQRMALS